MKEKDTSVNYIHVEGLRATRSETEWKDGQLIIRLFYDEDCTIKLDKAHIKCKKDMANLTVPFVSILNPTPKPGGGYRFVVQFIDTAGNLISSPNLPQNYAIESASIPSSLTIPVSNGSWSLNDVRIRVWSNEINSGCFGDYVQDIVTNCTVGGGCVATISNVAQSCEGGKVKLTVMAATTGSGIVQYGLITGANPSGTPPTSWQTSNAFGNLTNGIQYGVWVRDSVTTTCTTVYDVVANVANCGNVELPNCGCGTPDFTIASIVRATGMNHAVTFDACAVNPFMWQVQNSSGTVLKSGSVVPTTGTVTIDLTGLTPGTYTLRANSTGCNGQATKEFTIYPDGNGEGGGDMRCPAYDAFFDEKSGIYNHNYVTIVENAERDRYEKKSGFNADTIMPIMSCTKAITAALMLKLSELGLVNLNASISTYLPNFSGYGKDSVTIRKILSHTSNIVDTTIYESDNSLTVQSSADAIGHYTSLLNVTYPSYSSAAFQVAAAAAETVTGKSFDSLIREYIFSPLGMGDPIWLTVFASVPPNNAHNNIAGYGLSLSANNYLKFIRSLAGYGTQILSQSTKNLMFSDASAGIDTMFGYGCFRYNITSGIARDIVFEGASGCFGFINTQSGKYGLIWNQSQIGNVKPTNYQFKDLVATSDCSIITEDNPWGIRFVVNGTGNSFDASAPNGISPNKVNLFERMSQKKVGVVRHVMTIGDYCPAPGVYNDAKLSEAINWIRSRPNSPKADLLIVPLFGLGDTRIPENHLHVDARGHKADCTLNLRTVPSYSSDIARSVLEGIYDHLFSYLQIHHEQDMNMFSLAGGNSEEHYMPYASNFPGGPGCGDNGYSGIGDYSPVALAKWREWLLVKFGFGILPFMIDGMAYTASTAPLPDIPPSSTNNAYIGNNLHRRDIQEAIRFWNQSVYNVWENCRDKAKTYLPNVPFEFFVADMFNQQGIQWTMNAGTMYKAMKKADAWYHTDNINPSNWGRNLIGTDILLGGTFGSGKISSIEYDSTDAGNPNGGPINEEHVYQSIIKFIEHGGKIIHWALNWSDSQIDQLGNVMQRVYDYIGRPGWTPLYVTARASAPVVTLETHRMFVDGNYIVNAWEQSGNSVNNPFGAQIVNVRVANNGTEDTFWTVNT